MPVVSGPGAGTETVMHTNSGIGNVRVGNRNRKAERNGTRNRSGKRSNAWKRM